MDRPYVAQAIAVAALYGDLERQCQLARELMKDITDAMFMRGEKSLDLLEGLLVTIAWSVGDHRCLRSNIHTLTPY